MKRRNTATKEAVWEVLSRSQKALSHEAIENGVSIAIDRATIYRVLNRFCEDGVVHRIVAGDGKQYFATGSRSGEQKLPEHHLHFRCRACHSIECLHEPLRFPTPSGYVVEEAHALLSGICADCHSEAGIS